MMTAGVAETLAALAILAGVIVFLALLAIMFALMIFEEIKIRAKKLYGYFVIRKQFKQEAMLSMNLTIVYWVLCAALIISILVMAAGLVEFVTTAYESIQRIMIARKTQN